MNKNKIKLLMFFNKLHNFKSTEKFNAKVIIYKSVYGEDLIETVEGDKEYIVSYLQYYYSYIKNDLKGSFYIKVENKKKNIFELFYKN